MDQYQSQTQSTGRTATRRKTDCEIVIKFSNTNDMYIGPFKNREQAAIVLSGFVQNSIMEEVKSIEIKQIVDNL